MQPLLSNGKHNHSRYLRLGLALFSLLALMLGFSWQAPPDRLVLTGATLIDGLGGPPLVEAVVVIEGDRIVAIEQGTGDDSVSAQVVDLNGNVIVPGFVESHVHWEEWMGQLYLNHGITSVVALRNVPPERRSASHLDPGEPRVFHSGGRPSISASQSRGQVTTAIQTWLRNEPDMAHFPTFNEAISQVYRWAAEEVHELDFVIFGHAENAPDGIAAGLDVVEHVWGFTQAQMSAAELEAFQEGDHLTWATFNRDWSRLEQMIDDAVDRSVYLNPTLVYEWGGMSPLTARHEQEDYRLLGDPKLSYFPTNIGQSLLQKHRRIKNFSSRYELMTPVALLREADRLEFEQGFALVEEFVRRYVGAGGRIQAGTDAPSGGMPGLSLHHEMEMLVEAGLTPMQALQSATSWSAEILAGKRGGRGTRGVGAVRPGQVADLVVLSANPLEDIRHTQQIRYVMKGGRFVELGYRPDYFTFSSPPRKLAGTMPVPEISAIHPNFVVEGHGDLELLIEGVGFQSTSVVLVDGVRTKTRFEGPRRLRIELPAQLLSKATPNPFTSPGPAQKSGIYGDRTIPIAVYQPPPDGGVSGSISLVIKAKWSQQ